MKKQKTIALVLTLLMIFLGFGQSAKAVPQNNGSASVVVGQSSMTGSFQDQGGSVTANGLSGPWDTFYDGTRFFVVDTSNNRVLIYSSLPTSSNASADVVVGQQNMSDHNYNQTGVDTPTARTLNTPTSVFSDGTKLLIADQTNHRVLIFNSIPTSNNAAADVVIGQADMVHWRQNDDGGSVSDKSLNYPKGITVVGGKLFIADCNNSRVLVFNSIPTTNHKAADIVIGQANMTSNSPNRGGGLVAGANTLNAPMDVYSDGTKLLVSDANNNRVTVYNPIPSSNNASANAVIGQANMTSTSSNQGLGAGANTLSSPWGITSDGTKLLVADTGNHRVLIYNSIPTSDNTSASSIIGKSTFTNSTLDSAAANTLYDPQGMQAYGSNLFVADRDYHRVLIYKLKPTLSEVSTPSTNTFNPSYTFSSDEDGTISYGGDCASGTTTSVTGNNTIAFNTLGVGTYSNCTLTVTNGAGFTSSSLTVSPFTLSPYADSNLTLSPANLPYSKKKSSNKRATLTVSKFNLSKKVKKSWATIRVNGKKMRVSRVKNFGSSLHVTFKLVYGKWVRGNYNLSFSYKNQVGKSWNRGTFSGDNILTVY
jgi:hypothetical protein